MENEEFENLYLLYDLVQLLRNIYKNWQTEKIQKVKFSDPITTKEVTANLPDLIAIYKKTEPCNTLQTIFEKQKVTLVLYIFNEKTAAFLDLKGFNDTLIFNHTLELYQC